MPPVPVYVKGGVWTNLEDQIVKAAIQKYGTHQWSKIASLLQKKTAKQCETRWNEYLNPKINFQELSKEEDARLLELARRLPNQWRTIADAMGRTAQVCIDRYNRLMEGEDHDPELSLGSSLEFKVGDLNPKSDTLAAKPDDVELADDEREMLAEARARLLNTQGKKATRKIRERMLEESKRIAQLQKRRELKQAGINTAIKQPRKRYATEIDYNKDVVYEQSPVPGVYDTSLEDERLEKEFQDYENKVDRRGIKNKDAPNKDSARSAKRNKSQDDATHTRLNASEGTVLINEYKKPVLELPKPGVKHTILEEEIAIKRQKILDNGRGDIAVKQENLLQSRPDHGTATNILTKPRHLLLRELFTTLPKPKNDFEIILDDEDDEDGEEEVIGEYKGTVGETIPSQESRSAIKPKEKSLPLELDCLSQSHLPTPPFTADPTDDYQQTYNELVAASMIKEAYLQPSEFAGLLSEVEKQMELVQIEPNDSLANVWSSPSRQELLESIQAKRTAVSDMQQQLSYISPIVAQNDRISRKVCGQMLPRVRTLQHRYYVNYRMYQDEARGVSARMERLKADVHQVVAS